MKSKHCSWCDTQFNTKLSYQIYCSTECRESATREKIAEKYKKDRILKRKGKERLCKSCGGTLSIYNDSSTCMKCDINPDDVAQVLKEMRGIANGKIEL